MNFLRRAWAEIDLDALAYNVANIKGTLNPSTKLMGVVKADAYGHGARTVGKELLALGADWLGVSNINEALSLRRSGIRAPILIFGVTPPEYAGRLAEEQITQTVFSPEYGAALEQAAAGQGVTVEIHVKIDTGMGRIGFDGFRPEEACREICRILQKKHLRATGVFTHFSCSDELTPSAREYTRRQYELFLEVCRQVEREGFSLGLRHCCNSGGILAHREMQLDMVRAGLILYGLYPTPETRELMPLSPVMSLRAAVSMVKSVREGRMISYGRTFETPAPMEIATVPIGYADGYHRSLSNKGRMLLHGQYAPVVGRVCMDQLMLDVTGIPGVSADSTVTIVGIDGEKRISMEEFAESAGTINYEMICLVGRRVPRIYKKNGEEIAVVDYVAED